VASSTTVGGLIKHLHWAEYGWFDQLLQERSNDTVARTTADVTSLALNGTCDKMPPMGASDGGVLRFAPLRGAGGAAGQVDDRRMLAGLGRRRLLGLPRDP
jgi:hypothetical protein